MIPATPFLIGLAACLAALGGIAAWRLLRNAASAQTRGTFAALAALAIACTIFGQKPSPDTPTITVDALLRDVGCYATNNVFHAAVTNAPSYAGVDFSDCDLMVYARERASSDSASWFELTPRKKFSQQPADYAIENATNYNYMVYLNYVPPSPVHTNGVFELYGFVMPGDEPGNLEQLAAGFINSRAVTIRDVPYDSEVEYLESTGTQWIDTGYAFNSASDKVELVFELLTTTPRYKWIFGAYDTQKRLAIGSGDAQNLRTLGYNASTSYNSDAYYTDGAHIFLADSTGASIDGQNFIGFADFSTTSHILLYTIPLNPSVYCSNVRIWSYKHYRNGVLIHDCIPVRKGTTGFLYDRVSRELFGNAGTGVFGYGNDK